MFTNINKGSQKISSFTFFGSISAFLLLASGGLVLFFYTLETEISNIQADNPTVVYQQNKSVLGETISLDQSCSNVDAGLYENILENTPNEQSFIPQHNRLTRVAIKIGGTNLTGSTALKLTLLTQAGFALADSTIMPSGSDINSWGGGTRVWDFDPVYEMIQGQVYLLRLERVSGAGTPFWYTSNSTCYSKGTASQNSTEMPFDFDFETYGYYVPAPGEIQTPTSPTVTTTDQTTITGPKTTSATAPVVAPDVIAVPTNFKVRNNGVGQLYFSWDKNKEADLVGYVLYFYEPNKDIEIEIIDVNDKELDNYNVSLSDHPLLKTGTEYSVKLAAKNVAGAVSQKTEPIKAEFSEKKADVTAPIVEEEKYILTDPYVLGGLGLGLILLIGLLIFLEKKYHGLKNLIAKMKKGTKPRNK